MTKWFEVNKEGLAKLLEKRGKAFAVFELIQNAWDTNATTVDITLVPVEGKRLAEIWVNDNDPEGFAFLDHAFTLFAESVKKSDVTKRGRFNLGEKLVLAICDEAQVSTTKGTVDFKKNGERVESRKKTERGSTFWGYLRMSRDEIKDVQEKIRTLIPPAGIKTTFNGEELKSRSPVATFESQLSTEIADEEGNLRPTKRKTTVSVYEVLPGEEASIYELGIPIVTTGDKFHVDIAQKVPLNMDRDNVPPAYLRVVRTEVLNHVFDKIKGDEANDSWVREAASDKNCDPAAIEKVMTERFGEKRVVFDPSDPEANKIALQNGYTLIQGRSLSKGEWDNVKKSGAALPAGQVTPSPKPFHPDGQQLKMLERDKWTPGIQNIVEYTEALHHKLLKRGILVEIANDVGWGHGACYGGGSIIFNVGRLGYEWFNGITPQVNRLIIHEFGHNYSGDHFSKEYHDGLCKLGANMTELALQEPDFFKKFKR